jgi:hypothetical protein
MTFKEFVIYQYPTGSRYICTPPPVGTDNDTVFLVSEGYHIPLEAEGFTYNMTEVDYGTEGTFLSWRKGDENYIITEDEEFYNRFVKATNLAKLLNLANKAHRVALFQAILYDN